MVAPAWVTQKLPKIVSPRHGPVSYQRITRLLALTVCLTLPFHLSPMFPIATYRVTLKVSSLSAFQIYTPGLTSKTLKLLFACRWRPTVTLTSSTKSLTTLTCKNPFSDRTKRRPL